MTVCAAYVVPRKGCVVVCDSRVTDDNGWIYSDADHKYIVGDSVVAVCAGMLGAVWDGLRAAPPRTLVELRDRLVCDKPGHVFEVLASDGRGLYLVDQTGAVLPQPGYACIGSGGAVALGALDMSGTPKSLDDAESLLRVACKLSIKRNSTCGGRLRSARIQLV